MRECPPGTNYLNGCCGKPALAVKAESGSLDILSIVDLTDVINVASIPRQILKWIDLVRLGSA